MSRKRKGIGRKHGFKKGNTHWSKGKNCIFPDKCLPVQYKRLTKTVFDSRVVKSRNGTLSVLNVNGTPSSMKVLRPQPPSPELVDTYMSSSVENADSQTYKLYQPVKIEELFHNAMKEHIDCTGKLQFDTQCSEKWGMAWRERLYCSKCGYKSKINNIYDEVKTPNRGRKAASINIRAQNALNTTPISNQSFINILVQMEVIPPSYSGMQKTANKVGSELIKINQESMKNIRETIYQENKDCGLINPEFIRAESDGRFNNPMFKANTPFQAGTQVTYVMIENNSNLKRIVSVFAGNKLCNTASKLRNQGEEVVCPHHAGECTANIGEADSIGNESAWSAECVKEINDILVISHLTTDGDSKAIVGVRKQQNQDVESLKDIRHLSRTMRRHILNLPFSPQMFCGPKALNLKSRFAHEVTMRCVAELESAHSMLNNHIEFIQKTMPDTINAIIMCMKGYCGQTCSKFSYVCRGLKHDHWLRRFLPKGPVIRMNCNDELHLYRGIEVLLGTESLYRTRFLTSTQKSEAFNRILQRVNPKNVTWPVNFPGRAHTAVHMCNHGFVDSAIIRCEKLQVPFTKGTSVIKYLKSKLKDEKRRRKIHLLKSSRQKRCATRNHKFRIHTGKHCEEYKKGTTDPVPSCSKRKCNSVNLHDYADKV